MVIALLFSFIGTWIFSGLFIQGAYRGDRASNMETIYERLETLFTSDSTEGEIKSYGNYLRDKYNISAFYIVSTTTHKSYYYADMTENLGDYKLYLYDYYMGQDINVDEYLINKDNYRVMRCENLIKTSITDTSTTEYIDLYGSINDWILLVRMPLESIHDAVQFANRFYIYIGVIILAAGSIITFFITKRLTKPILKLSSLTTRMADLDFSAKYTDDGCDEIGVLGRNMNLMADKLEESIAELKTANIELRKDIAEKEEIDQKRQEFISNVSHELKTPIALIQGYAEGLKEDVNDDKDSRDFYCDVIMDESYKMNKIVRMLLSLNQLEAGGEHLDLTRFNIVPLIQGILESFKMKIEQNQARVIFDQSNTYYVWADEFRIEEVMTNFISNAFNHLDGERVIDIKLLQLEGSVRISVFNTGAPIPKEDIDKIWEKFYKVDKARTREYGGSGIGLSIVKAIMNQHGQPFGVVNHLNGVEFWLELDTNVD